MSQEDGPIRIPLIDIVEDPEMNRVLQYCVDVMVILRTSLFLRDMTTKTWGFLFANVTYLSWESRYVLQVFKVYSIEDMLRKTAREWPRLHRTDLRLFCNEFSSQVGDDIRDDILNRYMHSIGRLAEVMTDGTRIDNILTNISDIMQELIQAAREDEKRGVILFFIDFIRVFLLHRLVSIANEQYSNAVLRFVTGLYDEISYEIRRLRSMFSDRIAPIPWAIAPMDMMKRTTHVVEYTRSQEKQIEEVMHQFIDYSVTCSNIICKYVYSLVFHTTDDIEFTQDYMQTRKQIEIMRSNHTTHPDHTVTPETVEDVQTHGCRYRRRGLHLRAPPQGCGEGGHRGI